MNREIWLHMVQYNSYIISSMLNNDTFLIGFIRFTWEEKSEENTGENMKNRVICQAERTI